MFGFLRFYLAWMVVITHISTVLGHVGGYAVYSFYILSGYLMTLIMNKKYGYDWNGIKKYLLNRFLRIFPPYWFVAILTFVGILLFAELFFGMHKTLRMPESLHEQLANLTIFGLFPGTIEGLGMPMARLVPAAWALHVELCFYLLIGAFLGRFKSLVVVWFIGSLLYHVVAVIYDLPRYAPVYSASLPFSLGAMIFHFRDRLIGLLPTSSTSVFGFLSVYAVYILLAGKIPMATDVYPFYLNMAMATILICQLTTLSGKQFPRLKTIDTFLGDLSYPIYLSHWLIAVMVAGVFGLEKSVVLFIVTIPFLLLFSVLMKYLIDDPIERTRKTIAASVRRPIDSQIT